MLQSASDALLITDDARAVRFINRRCAELFALPPEMVARADADEMLRWIAAQAIDPETVFQGARARARPGEPASDELRLRDGRVVERTVSQTGQGKGWQRLIQFRDVTEQRRAEAELRVRLGQAAAVAALGQRAMAEGRLEALLEETVRLVGDHLQVEFVGIHRLEGATTRLLAGKGWPEGLVGNYRMPRELIADCLDPPRGAIVVADQAGSYRGPDVIARAGATSGLRVAIPGAGGPWGLIGAAARGPRQFVPEDLHFLEAIANALGGALERRRTLEELRRSAEGFRALIERSPDVVLVHDGIRVIYANAAAVAYFGFPSAAAMFGKQGPDLFRPEDQEPLLASVRLMKETGRPPPVCEMHALRADGREGLLEVRMMPVLFDGRRAYVGVGRDLAERRELESRLRLADRMASVGTLAAGVAHELNNPLAWVTSNLAYSIDELDHWLRARGEDARLGEVLRGLREAAQGAERMRVIVSDLKTFSRGDEQTLSPVDMGSVVTSALSLCANEIRHRARLVVNVGQVPKVLGNAARLGQVFINLLVNASQAIEPGRPGDHEVRVESRVLAGRVAIEVRDTGHGIAPEMQGRIFDPFFTTKAVGVGTGLGLSICHNIVSSLGGEIQVESEPGKGALFRVLLPALPSQSAPPKPSLPRPSAPPPRSPSAQRRVLVIDDEPMIGLSIGRALRKDCEVVSLGPSDALSRLESGERFDAILCDLLMPEMSGMDLYEELCRSVPEAASRMVFMTGGAFTDAAERFITRPGIRVLDKPFTQDALRKSLDAVAPPAAPAA